MLRLDPCLRFGLEKPLNPVMPENPYRSYSVTLRYTPCKRLPYSNLPPESFAKISRQPHHERQGNIQPRNILIVQMADLPSDSFAPDRDGLVGHDLRTHSQATCGCRIDSHANIWRIAAVRGHLANHHRCMASRECIRLHDQRRPRLAIVARRRQLAGSIQACNLLCYPSSNRLRPCSTTRRNSRKPRACRRPRIALICSAAAIVFPMIVTQGGRKNGELLAPAASDRASKNRKEMSIGTQKVGGSIPTHGYPIRTCLIGREWEHP